MAKKGELVPMSLDDGQWKSPVKTTHHPSLAGTEDSVVQTFDIGPLPLPNNAFASDQSQLKALQYAACDVPWIAYPAGTIREIPRNWVTEITATTITERKSALLCLVDDANLRKHMSAAEFKHFSKLRSHASGQNQMKKCWENIPLKFG
ncbi:MAG: hypothetical protein ORN51_13965 [Akkermansiaceae bacterium]|nr:hypothetical protein [Akkermansiaceae bacterium]